MDTTPSSKAKRRADREALAAYHREQLAALLERVRDGFARYDAGEIDAFVLDELIHQYHKATQKLWSFCVVTGGDVEQRLRLLEWQAAEGETTDWWEVGAPRRR